jgi:hypothetical protein
MQCGRITANETQQASIRTIVAGFGELNAEFQEVGYSADNILLG